MVQHFSHIWHINLEFLILLERWLFFWLIGPVPRPRPGHSSTSDSDTRIRVGTLSSLFSEFSKNSVYQKQDAHLLPVEAWAHRPISARRGAIRCHNSPQCSQLLEKSFEREKILREKWVTADKWRTHHRDRHHPVKMDHWVMGGDMKIIK